MNERCCSCQTYTRGSAPLADAQCYAELHRYLAYTLSAVLGGAKPSELVTLKARVGACLAQWRDHGEALAAQIGLSHCELRSSERVCALLWYRPEALERLLESHRRHPLLLRAGYPVDAGVSGMLAHLRARYAAGDDLRAPRAYPHEIGLFLGYPARDVEAFIACGGRGQCASGYWKVYGDEREARRAFARIDEIRSRAARLLASGCAPAQAIAALSSH